MRHYLARVGRGVGVGFTVFVGFGEIMEILARWTEPDARFFRVRGEDGRVYVLRLDERKRRWEVPEVASRNIS